MSTVTMPSTHSGSGATASREDRRRRTAGRRLVLMLVVLGALLVVGVAANYGPVTHYLDARQRMDKAAAEVAVLEERTAELQAQVGKLTQSGHLEDLARQQLSYALPGEELYVVTHTAAAGGETVVLEGATGQSGSATGAPAEGAAEGASAAGSIDGVAADGAQAEGASATDRPGLLERILLTVASLF